MAEFQALYTESPAELEPLREPTVDLIEKGRLKAIAEVKDYFRAITSILKHDIHSAAWRVSVLSYFRALWNFRLTARETELYAELENAVNQTLAKSKMSELKRNPEAPENESN